MGQGNGFPKTRSTEVKARVGDGIFGNELSTFLLQKRPSITLLAGIYKTRIYFQIESMTNILQNDTSANYIYKRPEIECNFIDNLVCLCPSDSIFKGEV